ncbi:MAG: DUF4127 family protein [Egibacteraceae bacterium]
MRIGLVPLDDRARSSRTPGMLGRIAGAEVVLPPAEAVGGRNPGSSALLAEWLRDEAGGVDALVVSLDQLAHGGAAYSSAVSSAEAVGRLQLLRQLRDDHDKLQLYASTHVAGIPGGAIGTPPHWAPHATALDELSELLGRRADGEDVAQQLATAEAAVPAKVRRQAMARRLRTHAVNLAALELAADETVDLLLLGTAGTGEGGLSLMEKAWVAGWLRQLDAGPRAQLRPGADELAAVLVTRLFNATTEKQPRVGFFCPVPGAEKRPARAEDGSAARTVLRQIRGVGAELVNSDADFVLTLLPPTTGDVRVDLASKEDADDAAGLLADEVTRLQAIGVPASIADVAHREGGDSRLVERMRSRVNLPSLGGYAAGGTAGDAVGAALAQGCALRAAGEDEQGRKTHELYVLHRFLDDWGYQAKLRGRVRRRLVAETGAPEPTADDLPAVEAQLERDLASILAQLPRFAGRYRVVPGSFALSWGRTFDCDFELERIDIPPAERR